MRKLYIISTDTLLTHSMLSYSLLFFFACEIIFVLFFFFYDIRFGFGMGWCSRNVRSKQIAHKMNDVLRLFLSVWMLSFNKVTSRSTSWSFTGCFSYISLLHKNKKKRLFLRCSIGINEEKKNKQKNWLRPRMWFVYQTISLFVSYMYHTMEWR